MIIKIKNLKLKTILGIHEWEKNFEREIIINAEIFTDFNQALKSDLIQDTVDYDSIITKIKNLVSQKKFKLIEKMAQEIMNLIMEDKRIKHCKLEVDKVKVFDFVDSFSITIEKSNG
jgi:FolB domain-containing protein